MGTPYKDAVLVDAPAGYWPDCVTDVSGNGYHLVRTGGTSATPITEDDGEVVTTLDGVDDHCKRNLEAVHKPAIITLELLIRPQGPIKFSYIISPYPRGAPAIGKGVPVFMGAWGAIGFLKGKADGSGWWTSPLTPNLLVVNEPAHIVIVAGASLAKIYVNNVLYVNDASNAQGILWTDSGVGNYPDPAQFYVGGSKSNLGTPDATSPNNGWPKIHVAHPALYNGELSAARVEAHYTASGITAPTRTTFDMAVHAIGSRLAHVKMHETSGDTLVESIGGNDFTRYGATLGADGLLPSDPTAKSISFDGTDDHLRRVLPDAWRNAIVTYVGIVKTPAVLSGTRAFFHLAPIGSYGSARGCVGYYGSDGKIYLHKGPGTGAFIDLISAAGVLEADKKYMVCLAVGNAGMTIHVKEVTPGASGPVPLITSNGNTTAMVFTDSVGNFPSPAQAYIGALKVNNNVPDAVTPNTYFFVERQSDWLLFSNYLTDDDRTALFEAAAAQSVTASTTASASSALLAYRAHVKRFGRGRRR